MASPSSVNSTSVMSALRLRNLDRVSATPLGPIQCVVSRRQDTTHRSAVLRRLGNSHAQGTGAKFGIGLLDITEAGLHPSDEHPGLRWLRHRQDHQKLVSTQPADHVQGSTLPAEHLAHLYQQAVTSRVTHRVVNYLESVQIQQQHAGMQLVPEAAGYLGCQPLLQRTPVAQPGQLIWGPRAMQLLPQLRVFECDRRRKGKGSGQLRLRSAIQL